MDERSVACVIFDVVLAPLRDEDFLFLVRVRRLFISCSSPSISSCLYFYCVCGRQWSWDFLKYVIKDTLNYGSAPDPFGRGEMAMSPPRCARLFCLSSEIGQDAPARRSVCPTGAFSSQLYNAKCLYFLTGIVTGAAGHNRGRVVETPLFARTQGGNFDGARHRCFWS